MAGMKSSKKKKPKKKVPPAEIRRAPAAADSQQGAACSPLSGILTLAAGEAAAAVETESSGGSSCGEASTYTRAFTSVSSGAASTSGPSSSDSAASSSAAGDERRDLAWLLDAFGSATIDEIESAYRVAGGDAFLAAGILGSSQDLEPPRSPPPPNPSQQAESSARKASRRSKRLAVAASGMVADVIGKGYSRPATSPVSAISAWKDRDGGSASSTWNSRNREGDGLCGDTKHHEEAEQFLCSMLGDNSEISMGVVRDVLGQYGYDVEKALDALLDICGMGWCCPNDEKNVRHSPNIFPGNGVSEEKYAVSIKQSPHQLPEEIARMSCNHSENGHEFFWGGHQGSHMEVVCEMQRPPVLPSRSTMANSKMPQQVLESLFKIPENRTATYEPSKMDWKKVVKKLQSYNHPIAGNNQERPKNGNGYQEFRGIAGRHYDTMKGYYQKAAMAYSKGEKSYASYLAEEGKHYRDLARKEDEKASREIFEARNKHITNTLTIDLHGQHVKQAIKLLKVHMLVCVCMPSTLLRVITGCGGEGTGKGKIKQSVIELVEKENIEWYEGNSGTVVLRLGGPREYHFLEHDSDSD